MDDNTPLSDSLASTSPQGHRRPGPLYAWMITFSAVVLATLVLWPLGGRTFVTEASFELTYETTSGIDKAGLNEFVVESVRDLTRPESLAVVLDQMNDELRSAVLKSYDVETIRNALAIKSRPGSSSNSVQYLLEMKGTGTVDEVRFLNSLIVQINSRINSQTNRAGAITVLEGVARQFKQFHIQQMDGIALQLNEVSGLLQTASNDISILRLDLEQMREGKMPRDVFARPSTTANDLSSLIAQRDALLAQPGITPYHPQVNLLRKQIEALQQTTSSPPATNGGFSRSGNQNATLVQNRFASGGGGTPAGAPISVNEAVSRLYDEIQQIDLTIPNNRIVDIGQQAENAEQNARSLEQRMLAQTQEKLNNSSVVLLSDLRRAIKSRPLRGNPGSRHLVWSMVIAGLLGVVVSANYSPQLAIRRFRSLSQVQRQLGVPVVSAVRSRTATGNTMASRQRLAIGIVRICEWGLLAILAVLLVASLMRSDVAATLVSNPLQGISESIWMLTGR